ncbi:unnamed protein product [Cuscuta campestris]|uniref:Uncharacterized protein n=1 Tax=Cuscuta campestris TaxID=132261 RepID=A0A484NC58_9ASTE|nr:unnamed protein product [Cuscuta campestris]
MQELIQHSTSLSDFRAKQLPFGVKFESKAVISSTPHSPQSSRPKNRAEKNSKLSTGKGKTTISALRKLFLQKVPSSYTNRVRKTETSVEPWKHWGNVVFVVANNNNDKLKHNDSQLSSFVRETSNFLSHSHILTLMASSPSIEPPNGLLITVKYHCCNYIN